MSQTRSYSYVGNELELSLEATRWKKYWSNRVRPFVRGRVLDVGAGLGASFDYLADSAQGWTCLEPDPALCERLSARLAHHARPPKVQCGTLQSLSGERFDTILYIDVLEHIPDDRAELEGAVQHLARGGSLIVLSPALPFVFSPFDETLGHLRRYTAASLKALTPAGSSPQDWFYLDGVGVLASLFARIAKRSAPTRAQYKVWDRLLVPVSRMTDPLTRRWFGRTIIMVWTKDRASALA